VAHGFQTALSGSRFYQASGFAGGYDFNKLMNVLVLTPVYPHSNNQLEGLFNKEHAQALQKLGVDVTVVLCKPWIPNWAANALPKYRRYANFPHQQESNGVPIVFGRYLHVPGYRGIRLTVSSCAREILRSIKNYCMEERFDLLQVHSAWPVGLTVPVVSETLKCPFVVTLHIEDDMTLLESAAGMLFYRKMMEQASAVVAVGNPIERFVREKIDTRLADRRPEAYSCNTGEKHQSERWQNSYSQRLQPLPGERD
jgi:hypothetical protein